MAEFVYTENPPHSVHFTTGTTYYGEEYTEKGGTKFVRVTNDAGDLVSVYRWRFEARCARPPAPAGRKDDAGKLDMNLLDDMPRAMKALVEVMQWAIVDKKPVPYERGSWLGVEPDRYRAAIKRHERSAAEQATAEVPARLQRDAETNLLHLAHTACSAMMALESTLRELEKQ